MNFWYQNIFERGLGSFLYRLIRFLLTLPRRIYRASKIDHFRYRNAPRYENPTLSQLVEIEKQLASLGVVISDLEMDPAEFKQWLNLNLFPENYHGGKNGRVWDEKLLEHWLSLKLLDLDSYSSQDIFLDVAAGNSPWTYILRDKFSLKAYAIDLVPTNLGFGVNEYYLVGDATNMHFDPNSITGMALHCSYEMFMKASDTDLIVEMARVLKPGGKAIILPLYMHTHFCAYSTPEYYGRGYTDTSAAEYINMDYYGVPSSRKYDPKNLIDRVLAPIEANNLQYSLKVLRKKQDFGRDIYCHFVLEITKPLESTRVYDG